MNGTRKITNILPGLKFVLLGLFVITAMLWQLPLASEAGHKPKKWDDSAGPLIAFLTPNDGFALNASTLKVQALIAAFKDDPSESFIFNGEEIIGINAGRLRSAELLLDDTVIDRVELRRSSHQVLVDFRVDLSTIDPGPHTLTLIAVQGRHHENSASSAFTLDQTLPFAEYNLVEDVATPNPFTSFSVRESYNDNSDDKSSGDSDSDDEQAYFQLKGSIIPSMQSDGIDLEHDKVIIAIGSSITVIEAGLFQFKGKKHKKGKKCNQWKWQYEDFSLPFIQKVSIERKRDGRWKLKIKGDDILPESDTFYLRIGDDWGGIDLNTGEMLTGLRVELDTAYQAEVTIGTDGGTVETTDANGIVIRLDIPPGALTQDTMITMTPLLSSPLPDDSTALHPGVKFEPEGLSFAEPATLTLDFSGSGLVVTEGDFIFLLTSPLTALPLYGDTDPDTQTMTARLHHFSTTQPGQGNNSLTDYYAWADPILEAAGQLTLTEIDYTLGLVYAMVNSGECEDNDGCQDFLQFFKTPMLDAAGVLIDAVCEEGLSNPSDEAFHKLLSFEQKRIEIFQGDSLLLRRKDCLENILKLQMDEAGRIIKNAVSVAVASFLLYPNQPYSGLPLGFDDMISKLGHLSNDAVTINSDILTTHAQTWFQNIFQDIEGFARMLCSSTYGVRKVTEGLAVLQVAADLIVVANPALVDHNNNNITFTRERICLGIEPPAPPPDDGGRDCGGFPCE